VGGALWLCGSTAADDTPSPPTTTTVDAPPPDPYHPAPAAPTTKKSAVTRQPASGARSAPVKTYSRPYSSPAAAPTVQRTVGVSTPTRHRTAKVVRKKQRRHVVTRTQRPVTITLASVPELVAAAEAPLPPADERGHPYLLGAGAAFALLALAGLSLQLLCVRSLRHERAVR
jgi:hypothetical protein